MTIELGSKKFKGVGSKLGNFWFNHYGLFFVLFFFAVNFFGAYVLYNNIQAADWTEEEKQEYISSKQNMTTLKKDRFDRAVQNINRRHGYTERRFEPLDNIFETPEQ